MRTFLFLFLLFGCINISAQHDFYSVAKMGPLKVGYCDSLIFAQETSFNQFDYGGPIPLFLQIWHPSSDSISGKSISYNDLRERTLNKSLSSVYEPLVQKMDSSFVWYNVLEDFINFDTIDYSPLTPFEVLDRIKTFKTRSKAKQLPRKLNYPVIVYHHGAQGLSDENFVLAEYFASRGYIVVSSNFHLPLSDKTYGHSLGGLQEAVDLTKEVIDFAKTLSSSDEIYYIGHSWGAQVGLSFLFEPDWVDAFVSMETTLEFWSEEKVSKNWAPLYKTLMTEGKKYKMPILFIANTMEDKPFEIFKGVTSAPTIHVSAKEEFGHESYTSVYLLRYLYEQEIPQPDVKEMRQQLELYARHLNLIEDFLYACRQENKLDFNDYKKDFFYHQFNAQID
jgi:dienelactone hydrolase